MPDCATAGVLGVTTSAVGSLMSTEAVKFLAGVGDVHVGRLHMYEALTTTVRQFTVVRDPARPFASMLGAYADACAAPSTEGQQLFDALAAHQLPSLDVREPHEKAIADLPVPGLNLPLSEVARDPDAAARVLARFSPGDDVVVYCAGGVRSGRFVEEHAELAESLGISLHSLPGGVQRWG